MLKNRTLILVQSGLHLLSYSLCCLCLLVECCSFLEGQKGSSKIVPPVFVLDSSPARRVKQYGRLTVQRSKLFCYW